MPLSEEKKLVALRLPLFIAYLAIGAAVFQYLEKESQVLELREIWSFATYITQKCNISEREKQFLIDPYLETSVALYGKWNYGNSLVFAFTLVTTIGYGNMVPKTPAGRIFCILYSFIGIPCTCLVLKSIGDHIAGLISDGITKFEKKCLRPRNPWKVRLKTTAVTVILTLFVMLPIFTAIMLVRRKDMSFLECFYFTFISLSTIGFGDFVPHFHNDSEYLLLLVWFVGLSFVSSILCSLNLWIEKHGLGVQLKKASQKAIRYNRKRVYQVSTRSTSGATDTSLTQMVCCVDAATQTDLDTYRIINR